MILKLFTIAVLNLRVASMEVQMESIATFDKLSSPRHVGARLPVRTAVATSVGLSVSRAVRAPPFLRVNAYLESFLCICACVRARMGLSV